MREGAAGPIRRGAPAHRPGTVFAFAYLAGAGAGARTGGVLRAVSEAD